MAYVLLDREKLRHNCVFLNRLFGTKGIRWAIVSKLLCGNTLFLEELLCPKPDQLCDSRLEGMYQDVITLYAETIELTEKPLVPDGEFGSNPEGHMPEFDPRDYGRTFWRAIVDVGLLDVECTHVVPADSTIQHAGASSDILVVNPGQNPQNYKVGDYIEFKVDYMGC